LEFERNKSFMGQAQQERGCSVSSAPSQSHRHIPLHIPLALHKLVHLELLPSHYLCVVSPLVIQRLLMAPLFLEHPSIDGILLHFVPICSEIALLNHVVIFVYISVVVLVPRFALRYLVVHPSHIVAVSVVDYIPRGYQPRRKGTSRRRTKTYPLPAWKVPLPELLYLWPLCIEPLPERLLPLQLPDIMM
jgi:hypothetical protein